MKEVHCTSALRGRSPRESFALAEVKYTPAFPPKEYGIRNNQLQSLRNVIAESQA